MESKPIVELDCVGLRYTEEKEVLKDIDFRLMPGEFVFLTGPSGAGKSSLLNLIHLALRPSRGRVRLFGRDAGRLSGDDRARLRRRVGAVFQDYRLLPHLSVLDNIALPLRVNGKSARYIGEHVPELVDWVKLTSRSDSRPERLSGGEQQRVAIARAVINKPELIIADEPTASVDEEMAQKLLFLFRELNKMGAAVILATHSKTLIRQFDYPVWTLDDGYLYRE
ncbi:MAG: ATP-binding cassette domain-containing protein [Rickettsiales bacterium]|jgi:cell division transport system ATP-binding protein|nr:ATP-binding cassette domain-containing protein [Rickettsiales bacterium]